MNNKNIIDKIFDPVIIKSLSKEIFATRRNVGDDDFIYDKLEKVINGKTYILTPVHLTMDKITDRAKNSCKDCNGTGRKVIRYLKEDISNPLDYVILSDVPTKGLSEEEIKEVVEREKKNKYWRVVIPCRCTIKSMIESGEFILSNREQNIIIRVDCIEKVEE
jgi:hypothetical protein